MGNRWVLALIALIGAITLLAWHHGGEEPLHTIEVEVPLTGSAR